MHAMACILSGDHLLTEAAICNYGYTMSNDHSQFTLERGHICLAKHQTRPWLSYANGLEINPVKLFWRPEGFCLCCSYCLEYSRCIQLLLHLQTSTHRAALQRCLPWLLFLWEVLPHLILYLCMLSISFIALTTICYYRESIVYLLSYYPFLPLGLSNREVHPIAKIPAIWAKKVPVVLKPVSAGFSHMLAHFTAKTFLTNIFPL